ncbi:solute carrier family 38 member 10 isoform 2-T2 [Rhinophrynus dorsalis]
MAASNWGLIMNIVNSIVGVSVLTMPFCFKQCGIVLGTLLLMLCSWMTHQSCMFLVKTASVSKRRTYAGLAFHAYGKAGKMLIETSMIGLMLGTCIAFYAVIGDLGSSFFARILGLQVTEGFRMFLLFSVSLCIVLPLSLQRNMMASIQSFSAMALMFYTVFMFVIVLSSFKHGIFSGEWMKQVSYTRWEGIFRCIPIFGMSFACQSQVLPTYDSLDEPSVKIMSSIFSSSLNVVTIFYVTVGFFGYISFTETIAGNVLLNFPSNLVTEMIRVGFMMSVAVGFPMMILPCRQALNTLLFEQQQKDGTFTAGGYMPPLRFKVLTLTVVFGTMVGGILIPNVETILGLTGATMGSLICFICPALIYKKIQKKALSAQFILGVGLVILVISTYATMTVTVETPTQIKTELLEREELKEGKIELKPDLPKISDEKPMVEEPDDDRDKPKLPPKKPEEEQPQIKGPIDVPQQEDGKKKQEEVQLDRPDQGIAVPVGEAHRHEPPVPRDEVAVDEKKDLEESEEKKPPAAEDDTAQRKSKVEDKVDIEPEEKDKLISNKGVEEQAPQQPPQEEGGPIKEEKAPIQGQNEPPYKDLEAIGKVKDPAVEEPNKHIEVARDIGENDLPQPGKALENQFVKDEKKELPAADLGIKLHEVQNAEQNLADNQEAEIRRLAEQAGKAELLDHAILLQVIKEQQVQQKRLLDQQEKLLEVIKEQHMEIHQQKDEEDQQEKPEGDVADLSKSKEELKLQALEPKQQQEPLQGKNIEKGGQIKVVADQPVLQKEPLAEVVKQPNSILNEDMKLHVEVERNEQQKVHLEPMKNAAPASRQEASETKKQSIQGAPNQKLGTIVTAEEGHIRQAKEVLRDQDKDNSILKREEIAKPVAINKQKDPSAPLAPLVQHRIEPKQTIVTVGEPALKQHDGVVQAEKIQTQERLAALENKGQKIVRGNDKPDHRPQADKVENGVPVQDQKPAGESRIRTDEEAEEGQIGGGGPEHEEGKPNRDLKLQNDVDLKRKRRDLGKEEETVKDGAQIISFHPVPNLKVNDLRGALESQLNQAAEPGLQVVHSRQIKQLKDEEKKM